MDCLLLLSGPVWLWLQLRSCARQRPSGDLPAYIFAKVGWQIGHFDVNLIAVALTCAPLLVLVLDESMCGADEQAQIHSDPELPMWTAL